MSDLENVTQSTTPPTRDSQGSDAGHTGGRGKIPFIIHYTLFGVMWALFFAYTVFWLRHKGISPAVIGTLLLVGSIARIVITPLFSELSDRLGQRWWVVLLCHSLIIPIAGLMMVDDLPTWMLFAVVVGYVGISGINLTIVESYVLLSSKVLGFSYSQVRGFLSFGVAGGALGFGALFEIYGAGIFPSLIMGFFIALLVTLQFLPRVTSERSREKLSLFKPLQVEGVGVAIIMAMLAFMSFAPFMSLGALFFIETRGFTETEFGWIMGFGILAEAVFFFLVGKRAQNWRVFWMLATAAGLSIIRYLGYGYGESLIVMMAIHGMHAFSFGLMHTMVMELFRRAMPEKFISSATGIYDMVSNTGFGIGAALGGYIFQVYGAESMINFCLGVSVIGLLLGTITALRRS